MNENRQENVSYLITHDEQANERRRCRGQGRGREEQRKKLSASSSASDSYIGCYLKNFFETNPFTIITFLAFCTHKHTHAHIFNSWFFCIDQQKSPHRLNRRNSFYPTAYFVLYMLKTFNA